MNDILWDSIVSYAIESAGGSLWQQRQRESGLTMAEFEKQEATDLGSNWNDRTIRRCTFGNSSPVLGGLRDNQASQSSKGR
jgi:hypothetical protein